MRTFIALKITPEKKLIDMVNTLKKTLEGEAIKWVDTNNLHLTLRFLGETSHEQTQEIAHILKNISQNYHPFQFNLKGVGFFKSKNQPRVLFLSIENDLMLKQLAVEIEEGMVSLGFSREEKAFNPHLTVGRIKFIQNKIAFNILVNEFKNSDIQDVKVSEVIFYQSILNYEGPIYKPINILNLI